MKKFLTPLACAALLFSACSDDDKGDFGDLSVPNTKELTQTLSADENSASITFSAETGWTATVTDETATRAGLSWLALDRYEGGSGKFTLKITLGDNATGEDRKALITIKAESGDSFGVSVTQVKTNKDGTTPLPDDGYKFVDYIEITDSEDPEEDMILAFSYDSLGRVYRLEGLSIDRKEVYGYATLEYNSTGIKMTLTGDWEDVNEPEPIDPDWTRAPSDRQNNKIKNIFGRARKNTTRADSDFYTVNVSLNGKGYATAVEYIWRDGEIDRSTIEYDANDYLQKVSCPREYYEGEAFTVYYLCSWTENNLTEVKRTNSYGDYVEYAKAKYNNDKSGSKTNIDINTLVISEENYLDIDDTGILALLGFYGKKSAGLVEKTWWHYDNSSASYNDLFSYRFDGNGYVTEVKMENDDPDGENDFIITYKLHYK